MLNPDNELFSAISHKVGNEPVVKIFTKRGYCRMWSALARKTISESDLFSEDMQVEAREIDLNPWQSHTFLRVTLNERGFIMDGVGIDDARGPFFGPEEEAPEYYRNSRPDNMINSY